MKMRILEVSWCVFHFRSASTERNLVSFSALKSTLRATQKGKKDKKGKKKKGDAIDDREPSVSFASGPPPGEGSDAEDAAAKGDISAPKPALAVVPDDLADEEWGPTTGKGKKGKKGKGKESKTEDEDVTEGLCRQVWLLFVF
jgi:translation initiation factor 5B